MRKILLLSVILSSRNAQAQTSVSCSADDTTYFQNSGVADRESWYGRALRRMGESRLCPAEGLVTYRFLWLRTFHRPVAVRVEKTRAGGQLWLKVLGGAGGYDPGRLVQDRTLRLTKGQWDSVAVLASGAHLWDLPSVEPAKVDTVNGQVRYWGGADGARWILESVDGLRYHLVDRWTPTPSDAGLYYALCRYLLTLSRLPLTTAEIY